MPLPDFLIAGVPKAGTTALHAALSPHPQIFLPALKEPKHFLSDGRPPRRGGPGDAQTYQEHVWRRDAYEGLFVPAPRGSLRGEATPFYLYDRRAQRRIAQAIPDVRLVLSLRDPVDRAHSNWYHLWSAGLEPEADFLTACRLEPARRAAGWADFWHYVALGRYGRQVDHLLRLFPRERVLFLRYRDLRDAPAATLDRVCEFLGVRTGLLAEVPRENVSRYVVPDTRVNAALRLLLRSGARLGHHFPVPVRRALRGPLLAALHRRRGRRPLPTTAERAALVPEFAADIELLQDVTGLSYADWLAVDRHAALR
jgi:hypothetical protein